jgi:hypothetical protein
MLLTHSYKTFSIDVKLHSPILNSYHAGDYIYQSRIDRVIVDRIVDRTTDPSQRGHRFSSLLYRGPSGYFRGQAKFTKLVRTYWTIQVFRLTGVGHCGRH